VGYVLANLRLAFPELSEAERHAIGRESYVQLAWQLIDVARAASWGARELLERVEVVGREHIDAALEKGHGAVGLTAHLGSFEFAMRIGPAIGLPITVIGRPLTNRLLRRDMQTSTGAELLRERRTADAARAARRVVVALEASKRRPGRVRALGGGVDSPGPR
jgi:lauroyl/myristoyl acyltransferase